MTKIRVQGSRFVDEQGRHVILHGINMVCKEKSIDYIGKWDETDFRKLKQWGFNLIRLGIIWDGVEPEPGSFDDSYLERLRGLIRLAHRYDQYVFLDMHQDLYSSLYGDGAPAWATLSDNEEYVPAELWSDAYLFNGAVQKAFDHFWNNTPGPDGIGIQDHYVKTWRRVVERLGSEPNVIGYDIMNEPFIGSGVQFIIRNLFSAYGQMLAERTGLDAPDMEELTGMWMDPAKKLEALELLEQPDAYRTIMDAIVPVQQSFEREQLMRFFTKVSHAIRDADQGGILFLETNLFSNQGVPSGVVPIIDKDGERDRQQAYAPHGYDLVTDTAFAHAANNERVSFIFERHEQTRQRLDMPMLIGEWGAYYGSQSAESPSVHIQSIFEKLLCSDAYWSYFGAETENYSSFRGVCRGYPLAAAGTILRYQYRHEDRAFILEWEEENQISRPTIVYLPDVSRLYPDSIILMPAGTGCSIDRMKGTDAGFVRIPPCSNGRRLLQIG
ncbi:cellulase family glycosylhydrolase [Paenibacillus alkaliterrae]|uniref:cellulase family glycosylhydrolase n=1 Tax=Paenibacillus alkaliterrae TaxID=320909 RepID=UPI001F47D740|nr:cellulase family glycosylhydrolase [Paenibacillus alkaliterrae]MCF2937971.1 cellulase family glycosylhydrolase [Paenibacillus alkaliterrae]